MEFFASSVSVIGIGFAAGLGFFLAKEAVDFIFSKPDFRE